jgi:hypothetical protein
LTSPTKQVWRVKVKSVSDSTQEEDQTRGTSEGVNRQEVLFRGFKITEHHTKR